MSIARKIALLACLVFGLVVSIESQVSAQVGPQVFYAQQIWVGDQTPIVDGAMVVEDGKVVAVGPRSQVKIPDGAVHHQMGDAQLIPGLIGAHTTVSGTSSEDRTLTPEILALDGFDYFGDYDNLLRSGITTIQISPGKDRLMPGVSGVVRLADQDQITKRTLSEKESLQIILSKESRNPPTIYEPPVGPVSDERPLEPTRPQLGSLTASLAGLRQILHQAKSGESFVSEGVEAPVVKAVANLLENKIPLRITANTTPEIQGAIGLAKEFEISIVLVDCVGLKPFAKSFEDWKPWVKGVILAGPSPGKITNPTTDQEIDDAWEYARELSDAGIPVAVRPADDSDLEQLLFVAGQFMVDGLDAQETLAAITTKPAQIMNVADQVGSLNVGCYADFVVLDGKPFALGTRVRNVFVGGKSVVDQVEVADKTTVVKAGTIYLGDGHNLEQGSISIHGKSIGGVGKSVSAPLNADVRSFGDNAVVVPGWIDMGTGLGMGGPLAGNVTLQTKLGDQLYRDDPAVEYARRNGITTALLSSSSGSSSPVVAFKLGDDLRVIKDPVAIRFKFDDNVATSVTTNQGLLKAGKAYVDSWSKYEKDLAEYEVKLKAAQEAEAKAKAQKPAESKESQEGKSDSDKSEGEKKPAVKDDNKTADAKPDKKDESEKPVTIDPISGTWEGELQAERLPPQMKTFKFELVLEGKTVTGTVEMLRATTEISSGSYDASSQELSITIDRRGNPSTISGKLDEAGKFTGSMDLGRMGTLELTAQRTVDKSKKPEPKPEPKPDPKPEPKPAPEKGGSGGDQPESKDSSEKAAEKAADKSEKADDKKAESEKDASKDETKETEKAAEKLEPPKKPNFSEALEPYKALLSGEIPAIVEAKNLNAIQAAADLFSKQYNIRTIIVGADDLARQADLLKGYDNISVCVTPPFMVKIEGQDPVNLAQVVAGQQLGLAFQSEGTTGSGQLPSVIQYLVSQGLSPEDALTGLSSAPAMMLSPQLNFGKIQAGKDADLVVLSGPPFEFSTRILAVMIDGQWVYEAQKQK